MSSDYRIATGHDVALGSLTVLSPQPMGRPIRPTERHFGLSRAVYDLGIYAEWVFDYFVSSTTYNAMLTTMGLASLKFAPVTIYTRNERLVYARYNAIVHLPQMGADAEWSQFFLRNVTFRFTELEPI